MQFSIKAELCEIANWPAALSASSVAEKEKTRESIIHLMCILSAPILLALFNTEWLYSPAGWLDPWIYIGYAFNYADPSFQDDYYKVSRLPWIISLFTAHYLFTPTLANHITHLGVFIATLVPLYLTLRTLVGGYGALIATLLFSVNPHVHGSGGWDYHNAISGTFYAWMCFFLTRGWSQQPRQNGLAILSAGFFFGLLVHTNILFVLFAPVLFVHFMMLRREWRIVEIFNTVGLILSGATTITIILALINWSIGRHFLFFKPFFTMLMSFAIDASHQKPWWHPWSASWMSETVYLSFTLAIVVCTIIAVATLKIFGAERSGQGRIQIGLYLQLFLACILWVVGQTAGHTFLDWEYFAYPLVFPSVAALAALVSSQRVSLPFWAILLSVLLLTLPLSFGTSTLLMASNEYLHFLQWNMLHSAGLFVVAVLMFLLSHRLAVAICAVVLLGIANTVSMPGGTTLYGFQERECSTRKEVYSAVIQLINKLHDASIPYSKAVLWHRSQESLNAMPACSPITMKDHLAGPFYELGYGAVQPPWSEMPPVAAIGEDKWRKWTSEGKTMVVLAQDNKAINEMQERLSKLGITSHVGSGGMIVIGQAHLRIDLLKLT